jgi:hypothetical protein
MGLAKVGVKLLKRTVVSEITEKIGYDAGVLPSKHNVF